MTTVCSDNKGFLYRQTRDWLVRQMRTGKLKPGSKLPGERVLANSLRISRCTARTALQGLEKEGFIERIPSKGAFIKAKGETRQIRLALVFPEAEISRDYLSYSNWLSSFEKQRGLMEGGVEFNSELSFVYCNENSDPKKYTERLTRDFDGAVFLGSQLNNLKQELMRLELPCVIVGEEGLLPCIMYNRSSICEKVNRYLWDRGCRSIKLLSCMKNSQSLPEKLEMTEKVFGKKIEVLVLETDEEKAYEKLKSLLPEDKTLLPDAFFCITQVASFVLLRLANERGWAIPDDFMVMGYSNDMKIRPTTPMLTYVKIPYYEMGITACRLLAAKILNNIEIPERTIIPAELIVGKTTK